MNWKKSRQNRDSHLWSFLFLITIISVYALIWYLHPRTLVASDQSGYSEIAYKIMTGHFGQDPSDHIFYHRIGLTVPVALFYKWFGINTTSAHLWTLLGGIMSILAVWLAVPSRLGKMLGIIILAFSPVFYLNSAELLPDTVVSGLMMLSAVLLYYRRRAAVNWFPGLLFPLLGIFFLFWAFLTKATAYWTLIFWIAVFIHDLRLKRFTLIKRFYLPAFGFFLLLGSGYLIFCNSIWGSPWARLESMQALTGQHLWTINGNWDAVKDRLWGGIRHFWFHNFYYVPFLGLAGAIFCFRKIRFWAFYALLSLFIWWFGSTSFIVYDPLPFMPRMFLPVLTLLAVTGGFLVGNWLDKIDRRQIMYYFKIVVTLILLIILLRPAFYPRNLAAFRYPDIEKLAMERFKKAITEVPKPVLILTADARSCSYLKFFFGYELPEDIGLDFYGNLSEEKHGRFNTFFYFINHGRSNFLHQAYGLDVYDSVMEANSRQPYIFSFDDVVLSRAPAPDWLSGNGF